MNENIQPYLLPNIQQSNYAAQTVSQANPDIQFQKMLLDKMEFARQLNLAGGPDVVSPFGGRVNNPFNGSNNSVMNPMAQAAQTMPMQEPTEQAVSSTRQAATANKHKAVQSYTKQAQVIQSNSKAKQKAPTTKYNHIIREAANKYGVDENLIHSIIKMESNYNPNVKSHAGAAGLMQLMPVTAKEVGVTDRYDIKQNILGGTAYFSKMLKNQNGNVRLALASYNAGPGNVRKYGGIPPFKETQNYVRKVMDHYKA
ncbi:MAG TPA: lytic transglycosylase domain-containing protein [Pseudogracilibacillus sp.]|nr:lytic transglycosylase domain-containing protein [Pseudogracilibacillus sp.]